jgi:hemerythrin superfamily protein
MNVIALLKEDHKTVSKLFKAYEAAKKAAREGSRQRIAQQICDELSVHAKLEEELFYPAVDAQAQGEDEKAEDEVKEADEEHRLVKALVAEIQAMDESADHFDAKVKVLTDVVKHHVKEEEEQLMPRSRKLLTKAELEEIGAEVASRKKELKAEVMNRPAAATARSESSPLSTWRAPSLPRRARSAKR